MEHVFQREKRIQSVRQLGTQHTIIDCKCERDEVVSAHDFKPYKESRVIAPLFLNLGTG
jgi:hypothetical protein